MNHFKKKYLLDVTEEKISDLKNRLKMTCFPDESVPGKWNAGTELGWFKELIQYWIEEFDWKKQEKLLNSFDQYQYFSQKCNLHYIYSKGLGNKNIPLLLLHGWPGSIFEFMELIPMLTNPKKYGINSENSFDVIVPCLPGYGLSLNKNRRFGTEEISTILHTFMLEELKINQFGIQGGDWGAIIGSKMSQMYPQNIKGLHLNFLAIDRNLSEKEYHLPEEIKYFDQVKYWKHEEMGYYFIQGTKPQTLAYALSDSPAGLAAWIAEKFYTWTDNDGSPESVISLDRILANISFYWFTNSVGSSFWPYYARHHREWPVTSANPVLIPTGYAEFPKEILRPPMSIAKETYTNIKRWEIMSEGGHFAALEKPNLLAKEICEFFQIL